MGKRSDFTRNPRDFSRTPASATLALLPHLKPGTQFAEPCAGDGLLIRHLEAAGHRCTFAGDIEPQAVGIVKQDAGAITRDNLGGARCIITNPPWFRADLHRLVRHWLGLGVPAWLLFDASWPFTKQSTGLMQHCTDIQPVGRVQWIEGSAHQSMDDCSWYRFTPDHGTTVFHPRTTSDSAQSMLPMGGGS